MSHGTPSPSHVAAAKKLVEVTRVEEMGVQMLEGMIVNFKAMIPDVPDVFWAEVAQKSSVHELVEMLLPVYMEHFTEEDIHAIVSFYASPVGAKYIRAQPAIQTASTRIGEQWGRAIGERVDRELTALQEQDGGFEIDDKE
eukprot:c41172_g1_i1.p1 GENE.c41172_g1_i1~~c41172_g1_i1.p1  ORF type:complete len:154 (+),score=38.16 c41172_g1_i1:42-464(+)